MNEDRTCDTGGTNLTHACSLDVPAIYAQLDALRAKHGADTPIGHRCSNLIEQLKNLGVATGGQRALLARNIEHSLTALG